MLNGAISGLASTFLNVPFQVIRTSMMVHNAKDKTPISMLGMMGKIYNQEGVPGFYRGFLPSLIRLPLGNAFYFATLEKTKKFLKENFNLNDILTNFLSSAAGIAVQSIVTNPIYVLSTRFEAVGFNQYKNIFDAVYQILKDEGIMAFTKGLKPLLVKEVPSHSIFYVLYELNNKWLSLINFIPKTIKFSISSMLSSSIVTVCDNPLDLIRTREQYQFISKNKEHNYPKIFEGIRYIYANEGLAGLMSGVQPRIVRKLFSNTVLWTVYEILKRSNIHRQDKDDGEEK